MKEMLDEKMKAKGWCVITTSTEGTNIAYSYSIGLMSKFNFPEILICGLSPEMSMGLVHSIVDLLNKGERVELNKPLPDVIQKYNVILREIGNPSELSNKGVHMSGNTFYVDDSDFKACQLLIPDEMGRLPTFDSDVKEVFIDMQLGHVPLNLPN
jgi:hypothetical protein